jgi:hypothetical protein
MKLYCPNCSSQVADGSMLCEGCKADFSDPQGWKPTQAPGMWKPEVTKTSATFGVLSRGLLLLVLGPVLALLIGFGSYFGSVFLLVLGAITSLFLLAWIFAPLAGLGGNKPERATQKESDHF